MVKQEDVNYYLQDITIKNAWVVIDIEKFLKNYHIKLPNNIVINEKGISFTQFVNWFKTFEFPKTYEECCEVLGIRSDWHLTLELDTPATRDLSVTKEFDYVTKLESLRKLRICRDAYWKIIGERMGLGEPWEPDWTDSSQKYIITYYQGQRILTSGPNVHRCLPFPIEAARDSFNTAFDKLIEDCRDFL